MSKDAAKKRHMKKGFSFILFFFLSYSVFSQDYDIGIRAGLNFSKFLGPSETEIIEEYKIASGFHFHI